MKKISLFAMSLILLSGALLCGCQQAQAPSERITSFLGVSLGASKTEVASIIGNPAYTDGNFYYYGTDMEKRVWFLAEKADQIVTSSSSFPVKNIQVGHSISYVFSLLGAPDKTTSGDTYIFYYYNKYGVIICFDPATNLCYQIGIYSGDY